MKGALLLCFCPLVAFAALGVDISQPFSASDYSCAHGSGYSFAVPRAYQSNNVPDPNACTSIKNAHAGGIQFVDVYIFPCPTCGNAAGQINSMVNALRSAGCGQTNSTSQGASGWGQIWLDIEGTQYWTSSQGTNINFYNQLIAQCRALGIPVGTYSSASQWNPIMGSGSSGGGVQLWLADWTGSCNMIGANPGFGGWTKVGLQQYRGDTTLCGMSVDLDCY